MEKEWLYGKDIDELKTIVTSLGMPSFSAKQIAQWIYTKNITSVDEMTNLSLNHRLLLNEKYEVGSILPIQILNSLDGTSKLLFPSLKGADIESVIIPDKDRTTICVSSQSGCKMGCKFCMTARSGFIQNLSSGEILNQIRHANRETPLSNIVYMGMGEPLDNYENVLKSIRIMTSDWGYGWSPTRITLSTIGVLPILKRFIEECKVHLAVSMHSPFSTERQTIMPMQKAFDIMNIISLIRKYDFSHQRRVSFEYIMFKDINDSIRHANGIIELLKGLSCRINLIRFHKIPDSDLEPSTEDTMLKFRDYLTKKGITTTIRASRGEDIFAACGMLSAKKNK